MIKLATVPETKEVYKHFSTRKDIFPHIRFDYIQRMVAAGSCVYEQGVLITFQQYKRTVRVGDFKIPSGSIMLHQILNTGQFNGSGKLIFEKFCKDVVGSKRLYLAVRSDNEVARKFYERNGMKVVGKVEWSMKGVPLPGVIYEKL